MASLPFTGKDTVLPSPRRSTDNLAAPHKDVMAAGYNGETVVFFGAADVPRITASREIGADILGKIGLNIDYVTSGWGTAVQRVTRRQPIAEGGWSIVGSMFAGLNLDNPAGNMLLRGNGKDA